MTEPVLLSAADYARHRGVSRNAVSKALKAGRITSAAAAGGRQLIDRDAADIAWAASVDPDQQHRGSRAAFAATERLAHDARKRHAVRSSNDDGTHLASESAPASSLLHEKTRFERLRIQRQEIELAAMRGELVSRAHVEAALGAKLVEAVQTLQAIPDRFSAVFAAESNVMVIHAVLSDEIRRAMASIAGVPDKLR